MRLIWILVGASIIWLVLRVIYAQILVSVMPFWLFRAMDLAAGAILVVFFVVVVTVVLGALIMVIYPIMMFARHLLEEVVLWLKNPRR